MTSFSVVQLAVGETARPPQRRQERQRDSPFQLIDLHLVSARQDRIAGYRVSHGPSVERQTFCNLSADPEVYSGSIATVVNATGARASALPRKRKQNRVLAFTAMGPCGLMVPPCACFKLPNRSLESCATNSPILNGPPSSRCFRTSRAACRV